MGKTLLFAPDPPIFDGPGGCHRPLKQTGATGPAPLVDHLSDRYGKLKTAVFKLLERQSPKLDHPLAPNLIELAALIDYHGIKNDQL